MSEALLPPVARPEITRPGGAVVLPAVIVDAGPAAVERFLEFFAARIANARTRAAYGRAVGQFLAWCEARRLGLAAVSPLHVAAYIRTHPGSAPTVTQHLAALRMLGDWLVVSQVIPVNPAAAVRGPTHVVTTGATPVLAPAEARRLLAAIDPGTLAGLRDRALVSVRRYSVARVSAVIAMWRPDDFRQERQGWLRLHEKGGTRHDVPAHHRAGAALDDSLARAGLDAATAALFQRVDPAGRRLTGRALSRRLVLAMITRRAAAADLPPSTCCHTFRATGITAYLSHGGTLEHAQPIRRARLAEDDDALRPDGGHDHRRRDRAHRDLGGGRTARRRSPRDVRAARRDGRRCQRPSPPRLVSCGEDARCGRASSPLDPWGLGVLGRASRARRAHPGRCALAAHPARPPSKIHVRVARVSGSRFRAS